VDSNILISSRNPPGTMGGFVSKCQIIFGNIR